MSAPFAGLPTRHFGAILVDPPWAFRTWGGQDKTPTQGQDPYTTMSLDSLKALPVGDLAARNSALFMWVIDSHIDQALDLAAAWGFALKTRAFTWRKLTKDGLRVRIGMGRWTRKQTEMCLLFTRGSPPRLNADVREIIDAGIREHSRKPDEQYERIERLVGGPYLELFARQQWPGWFAWGNEVGRFPSARSVVRPDLLELLDGPLEVDLIG